MCCSEVTGPAKCASLGVSQGFVAVRTVAVSLCFWICLSDTEKRKDLVGSAEATAVEVLAETVGENDPASARYKAGLRDDIRKDGQSIAVAEFISTYLYTYQPPVAGLARISGEVESILYYKELCVA